MGTDWKQDHANTAEEFAQHEIIEDVLTEFAYNMGFKREGLPEYGLKKIVYTVAQIVLARARGIDIEALRMSDEEVLQYQARLAKAFLEADKPVFIVTPRCEGEAD